jgi:hypothetical protein
MTRTIGNERGEIGQPIALCSRPSGCGKEKEAAGIP